MGHKAPESFGMPRQRLIARRQTVPAGVGPGWMSLETPETNSVVMGTRWSAPQGDGPTVSI